jgi:hypothetical protein
MANMLTNPPFAADPPIKINVPAKTVGLVAGILGIIGVIFLGLFGLIAAFALTTIGTACSNLNSLGVATNCGTAGIFFLALIGVILAAVGALLYLIGGFQMYGLNRKGKDLVIYGLALGLIGGLLDLIGGLGAGDFIFALIWFVVGWYIVVISRWPGDAPLVASGPTGGYGNPPGGYGSPPPPPPSA